MKKALHIAFKIGLIVVSSVVLLLTLGWFILTNYIKTHQTELINGITHAINQQIDTKPQIKSMEPAIMHSFPNISVRLKSVSITDSLFEKHKIKTLNLESVIVKLDFFSLFSKEPRINKLILKNGEINFFVLDDYYSNDHLFHLRQQPEKSSEKNEKFPFKSVELQNVTLSFKHNPHYKRFRIDCKDLLVKFQKQSSLLVMHTKLNLSVEQLGFNLRKGSYLQNKKVEGNALLTYNSIDKTLAVQKDNLKIDDNKIDISAIFAFQKQASRFQLNIKANSISYEKAIGLLTPLLYNKLNKIQVNKDIRINADIVGGFQYPDTPRVAVAIHFRNNSGSTEYGNFEHARFDVLFDNELTKGKGRGDANSGIFISSFNGKIMGLPIQSDSIRISDLKHPFLAADLRGKFRAGLLNGVLGNTFAITKGQTEFELHYKGFVNPKDSGRKELNGYILLKNANLSYLPRSLNFNNCNTTLIFEGEDIHIKSMNLGLGKNRIQVRGTAKSIVPSAFDANDTAKIICKLSCPKLNLNEFEPLLKPRKTIAINSSMAQKRTNKFEKNIDALFDKSIMTFDMDLPKIIFGNFLATDAKARLEWKENGVTIHNTSFIHAEGLITFDAKLQQLSNENPFVLEGSMNHLKLDKLFAAFNNFGQNTLTSENLKGDFSASFDLSARLKNNAALIPRSLNGQVSFDVNDGELNNFSPFVTLSKFMFKKRKLNHITFQNLSNKFTIEDGKIHIPNMKIESSALNMDVGGIYSFHEGTDIRIKVPLRNPQKGKHEHSFKNKKGITFYFSAKDGEDGKVYLKMDSIDAPFKESKFIKEHSQQ